MKELDKILNKNEKIMWEGKPKFLPYVLWALALLIIWLVVLILAVIFTGEYLWIVFILPHFWVFTGIVFGFLLYRIFVYSKINYAITNKRAVLQKGLVGRDFETIDFDQITNAEVNVGVSDVLCRQNTGSILLASAGSFTYSRTGPVQKPYTFSHIQNPYDVFKFFKKVSYDVKTDIEYPNKYRPKTNPGYGTDYTGTKAMKKPKPPSKKK